MSEEFNEENVVYEYLGRIMGLNAYELAVRNGYVGTEEEWLESLIGKTAFEVAQLNGFTGTQSEWLESLKSKVLNITKTTDGNTNTYTMTFNNGNTQTFTVENGKEIVSVIKQVSTATESTLLITYNDGTTETVTIPNGTGISSIEKIGTVGLVDTYRINYTDKEPSTFTVTNGNSIVSIVKTSTNGIIDTYTITYSNGTTDTFELRNSIDTVPIDYTSRLATDDNGEVYTIRNQIGQEADKWGNDFMKHNANGNYVGIKIPVNGGQIFRITAYGTEYFPTFAVTGANDIIKEKEVGEVINRQVNIVEDGFLFICTRTNYNSSILKVTIFNEVETAINAIPSKQSLVNAVIEALPLAEEEEF